MEHHPCPHPGCDLPAEILERTLLASTHGPVEHARLLCVGGHRFFMPTDMLPLDTLVAARSLASCGPDNGHG